MDPTTKIRAHPQAAFRRLSEERGGVLLNLETAAYHAVNDTGALIWELLEPGTAFQELVASLQERLEDPGETLEADAAEFVADLAERGLVTLEDGE
ncbi:MAG: PqqD family protein [Acidimicrobiia bacterium]